VCVAGGRGPSGSENNHYMYRLPGDNLSVGGLNYFEVQTSVDPQTALRHVVSVKVFREQN
jgi:hypothetical protein